MTQKQQHRLLNPRPNSKIAAAQDYGIDLTLVVANLSLTPEQRLEKLQQAMTGMSNLRRSARKVKLPADD